MLYSKQLRKEMTLERSIDEKYTKDERQMKLSLVLIIGMITWPGSFRNCYWLAQLQYLEKRARFV